MSLHILVMTEFPTKLIPTIEVLPWLNICGQIGGQFDSEGNPAEIKFWGELN